MAKRKIAGKRTTNRAGGFSVKKTVNKRNRRPGSGPYRVRSKKSAMKTTAPEGMERLQKVLAAAGIDSRRNCEELIVEGVVSVNRKVIDRLPAFVDPTKDIITVYGKRLKAAEKVYFLLNKPKGVICTNSDPERRKKAIDLIDTQERIFCVGRLDGDTMGAIILTNDNELTNRLTHPKYELPKTYQVTLREAITGEDIELLKKGVWLSDGKTNMASVKVLKRVRTGSILEMTITQGLNRQIRRMFAKVGYKVMALKRTHIGNINVKGIKPGEYKKMTISQVNYLKKMTKIEHPKKDDEPVKSKRTPRPSRDE